MGIQMDKLSKNERLKVADHFKRIARGIEKTSGPVFFTDEEKRSIRIVAEMLSRIASGWKTAGTKRLENPTAKALYFRFHRAKKALEAAKADGIRGSALKHFKDDVEVAESEYRTALEAEKKKREDKADGS